MAKNKNHHLHLRGNVWYFEKMVKGKRIKKALSESLTEARRMRDEFEKEILMNGEISAPIQNPNGGLLFGEVAMKWANVKTAQVKASTMRDYRSAMNLYVLPRFGNAPIRNISYLDIEEFKAELNCTPKRVNNILVPIRSVFDLAFKSGFVDENIMLKVDNLRTDEPTIKPLTIDEVKLVLENVTPHFKDFFTVAFFTGMRFGEMVALKWKNVDLNRKLIYVRETRVYGVEDRPKTKKSIRDIEMLPPVLETLSHRKKSANSDYVFLDESGRYLDTDHVREVIWKKALLKAGVEYRPLIQTRHTFATMMIDAGEDIGWVQRMLGHSSLQMIYTKYYSWIKKATRNDGKAFGVIFDKTFENGVNENGVEFESEEEA